MNLNDKVAIVTGASSGIGRAISESLLLSGAKVIMNARREERLTAILNDQNPAQCCLVAGDANDEEVIDGLFAASQDNFKVFPDIVVVNAGRGLAGSVVNANLEEFEELVKINLIGASKLLQKTAKNFLEQSKNSKNLDKVWDIVVLGSISGRHISPFSSLYGSTKFAIGSIAEAMRRELAPKGIRVTLIEPALVLSEFQEVAGYEKALVDGFKDKFGKLLVPEDVARLVNFIISQPPHVHINDVIIRPTRQDYP